MSKRSLPGNPAPSAGAEDRDRQFRALNTPVRSAVVTVEYVDAELGIADAREIETGGRVSLDSSTEGFELAEREVGLALMASITRFQHAVKVAPVSR